MSKNQIEALKLISKITMIAISINETTIHHIFFNYAGHVNAFECSIYLEGWKENIEAHKTVRVYIDEDYTYRELNNLKHFLVDIYMGNVKEILTSSVNT